MTPTEYAATWLHDIIRELAEHEYDSAEAHESDLRETLEIRGRRSDVHVVGVEYDDDFGVAVEIEFCGVGGMN